MNPLSTNDIEAELSYAYIHAVAAKAKIGCRFGDRHDDNAGIDAHLTAWGPFPSGGYRTEVDLKVQLKATTSTPTDSGDSYSYFLKGVSRYDDLRQVTLATPRILVVLFLPTNDVDWLSHSPNELMIRKCAYWVSLRGAAATDNASGKTVDLPKAQPFTPETLNALMTRLSRNDIPQYGGS